MKHREFSFNLCPRTHILEACLNLLILTLMKNNFYGFFIKYRIKSIYKQWF